MFSALPKPISKQHEENEKSIVTTVDEIIIMIPTDAFTKTFYNKVFSMTFDKF